MANSLGQAATAARDRQLQVIALTGLDSEALTASLRDSDIEIRAPTSQAARILENHRLVIHCLCDLIDLQLMGG
jgi:phosphoheptose isomerase